MLKIKRIVVNMLEVNCYIVSDDSKEALIIDDGAFFPNEHQAIDHYLQFESLTLKHVICTHGHFDHTFGLSNLYNTYGLKPQLHAKDAELYINLPQQIQLMMGTTMQVDTAPLGNTLKEGDVITLGTHQFEVIETPGHTPGGICLYCAEENTLFSGDSLFEMSIGRTDFPGGNTEDLISSLKNKLLTLPDNTKVYTGHGNPTTIGHERQYNLFLR